jgi:hypothetical protein
MLVASTEELKAAVFVMDYEFDGKPIIPYAFASNDRCVAA